MRLGQRGMQLGDTILPADGAKLAREGDEGGDRGETRKDQAQRPEKGGAAEQVFDKPPYPDRQAPGTEAR